METVKFRRALFASNGLHGMCFSPVNIPVFANNVARSMDLLGPKAIKSGNQSNVPFANDEHTKRSRCRSI